MDFVAALMLGAGVLGGAAYCLVNHHPKYPAVLPADRAGPGTWTGEGMGDWLWQLAVAVVLGIAAAAVVPVFLHATSSNLINELYESAPVPNEPKPAGGQPAVGQPAVRRAGNWSAPYVFFGFCVLAAYAAQRFLQAMLDRVLRELEEQKARTNQALAEAREARRVVDSVERDFTAAGSGGTLDAAGQATLTDEEKAVLGALARGWRERGWKRTTVAEISGEAQLAPAVVQTTLDGLGGKGLVERRDFKGQPVWGLTEAGTRWRP